MTNPYTSLGLAGKVAIVTGGTRGIGSAIAEGLLSAGCEVTICGRNVPTRTIAVGTSEARFESCDVRDADQARAFVDGVAARYGRLDILVNNAGGSPSANAATASPRFSAAIVALNLLAPLYLSQAAFRWMSSQSDGGSIVNIASVSAERPSPGTAIYGAAKAGLLSLTQTLAQEWGPRVRVNAIVAGLMETESSEATYGSPSAQAAIADSLPLKRMGRGEDVAGATLFLASSAAAYVSGARLHVTGGGERPYFLELVKGSGLTGPAR